MQAAKLVLRKEMKQKLQLLTPEEKIIQSENVTKKLLAMPEYQKCRRLSIFLSMKDEIQTEGILKASFKSNKTCFIPRYKSCSDEMDMVVLHSWADFESLPETKWKIKQPPLDEEREEALKMGGLDVILVPGLAFSSSGKRLGRGRGYYDRYLSKCLASQMMPPVTIALAFNQQIVENIPMDDSDVPVNIVLTSD